jgi:hypothetical protein
MYEPQEVSKEDIQRIESLEAMAIQSLEISSTNDAVKCQRCHKWIPIVAEISKRSKSK